MLNSQIPYLSWGAIVFLVLFAIGFSVSAFHFRRARRAPYYIIRESARKQGRRWLIISLVLLALGLALLYLESHPPPFLRPIATASPLPSPSPSPSLSPTSTSAASPLPTPTPSATLSPVPTRRATATPPFIPTPTPLYPLPPSALTPQPDAVPAGPDAQITVVTLAMEEEGGEPVDPGFEFPPGDHRVYLFFEYRGMARGIVWTYAWYQDGEYRDGNTCLWGVAEEGCPRIFGRRGDNFLYYKLPGGYEPGVYDVRIWIEGELQDSAQFVITEAP